MSLVNCPDCRERISESAKKCPYCGKPSPGSEALRRKRNKYKSKKDKPSKSDKVIKGLTLSFIAAPFGALLGFIVYIFVSAILHSQPGKDIPTYYSIYFAVIGAILFTLWSSEEIN